ncbi:MAG: methyltransferase domain-containing protein [Acidimicrobiia bacterium]|nr:methyltransferase domain-containing protein [Acidimicrobiia bacterium]
MRDTSPERTVTWYHTIELPSGPTNGEYDLRQIVDKVPWPPSLPGARCLDVGTHDGFWAFEMERRGADEVMATDIATPDLIDWPEPRPVLPPEIFEFVADRKTAFHLAKKALGSAVEHRYVSVYDLDPGDVGQFDVVFIGTLLHHLRDPVGALMAIRRVCRGQLLVSAVVSLTKSILLPATPLTELLDFPGKPLWAIPNIAGLRRQIESAGFEVERRGPLHFQPTGGGRLHDPLSRTLAGLRTLPSQLMLRKGVPHVCMLARPVR